MPDRTPAEVFHALVDAVPRLVLGDHSVIDDLVGLYARRTHVVHPFAPFGIEPLTTRDDLRRHFLRDPASATGVERFEAVARVVHATADPEVVVAEFRYQGSVDGRPFDVPCIFVLRVRDGEIVESHDYLDHVGLARAFGRIEEFAADLPGARR